MNTLTPASLKLLSAGIRHLKDSEELLSKSNFDQAKHLAGFGPECIRKCTLSGRWADKLLGHSLGKSKNDKVIQLICGLEWGALRYVTSDWGSNFPNLSNWDPQCRYKETGSSDPVEVKKIVEEARNCVDAILINLWADGRLPKKIK